MARKDTPIFASTGNEKEKFDVRLSYKIVDLFSKNLYSSPSKAIEELVANSFDAGAKNVQVITPADWHSQNATVVIIDDGTGMNSEGLKQHWLIGTSNKRKLSEVPEGRQQIGKFGIGKLATYVLSERFSHVTKKDGKFYAASMDYTLIDKRMDEEVEPKQPIKISLRELNEKDAKQAIEQWESVIQLPLFGKGALPSWTVAIMSSLKEKVHEIKPGILEWILRTALPLRPDFSIIYNQKKLVPSKQDKGIIKKIILGKDIEHLSRPAPQDIVLSTEAKLPNESEFKYGLEVPGLGRVTGYAELYKDLLTGNKSEEIGRSHGFFVYVFGRLVNVTDGHFGIFPNELRHGTFGRIRVVIHINSLDSVLRSNREQVGDGPTFEAAKNVLRGIFNVLNSSLEKFDKGEAPGAQLSRRFADSPGSLSRQPILELARQVTDGKVTSRFILVPSLKNDKEKEAFLLALEKRTLDPTTFITGLSLDYDGSPEQSIAQLDVETGLLRVNAWHPFVATFYDEFVAKGSRLPLELMTMAEILAEAHLYKIGVKTDQVIEFLERRDQLLRNLANESGRESAHSVAIALKESRNNPNELEKQACAAFRSLGFEVTPMGGKGKPDGVGTAVLPAGAGGLVKQYKVSIETKSKEKDEGKVSARTVDTAGVVRNRDQNTCQHAIVIGRDFPATEASALLVQIEDDRKKTIAMDKNNPKTLTLITIDDLAELVRLRPIKQVGLHKIRELFTCKTPQETRAWIEAIQKTVVTKPPYKKIVETIHELHKLFTKEPVKYSALRVSLAAQTPSIRYETDEELADLCKAMAQMAPNALFANSQTVELDQSPANVISAIEAATKELQQDTKLEKK